MTPMIFRIKGLLLGLPLVLALGTGCGGGGGTTLTEDKFCEQRAQKECQVAARCGTVTVPACEAARKATCLSFGASSKMAPRVFRPENTGKCLNATAAAYAKTTITPTDMETMNDACSYVYQGSVAKLENCTIKYDCAGALICDKGKCADRVVKNSGDLCGNPGEVCAAGSYCFNDGGTYSCVAKEGNGDACSPTTPCVETLRCSNLMCTDRLTAGANCTSNDDCGPSAPYCDPSIGNKCDLGLAFAPGAAACEAYGGGGSGSGGATGSGGAGGLGAGGLGVGGAGGA